jgi:hypothetical protein
VMQNELWHNILTATKELIRETRKARRERPDRDWASRDFGLGEHCQKLDYFLTEYRTTGPFGNTYPGTLAESIVHNLYDAIDHRGDCGPLFIDALTDEVPRIRGIIDELAGPPPIKIDAAVRVPTPKPRVPDQKPRFKCPLCSECGKTSHVTKTTDTARYFECGTRKKKGCGRTWKEERR